MRIKGLDFLRGIAIIGVLFRHNEINLFLSGPGGYGVDLFFVLSGFLVSGLLFSEYKKRNRVNIKRFLIRRGFKIYPAFYFFILSTILIFSFGFDGHFAKSSILSEVFFMQSYFQPMWSHTWSLAVEEHFYLIIALMIYLVIKFKLIRRKRLMTGMFTGIILLTIILRYNHVMMSTDQASAPFFYTHLRIDGLFMGALLGYVYHFIPEAIKLFYSRWKIFAILTLILLSPAFIFSTGSFFMLTIGFNLLHLAFAFAVLLFVHDGWRKITESHRLSSAIISAVCTIGVYSYSIYLWHLPVQNLLLRVMPDLRLEALAYLFSSIAVGIIFSFLIEKPMLRLRDNIFPKS